MDIMADIYIYIYIFNVPYDEFRCLEIWMADYR